MFVTFLTSLELRLWNSCEVLLKASCAVSKNWDISQLAIVLEDSENKCKVILENLFFTALHGDGSEYCSLIKLAGREIGLSCFEVSGFYFIVFCFN